MTTKARPTFVGRLLASAPLCVTLLLGGCNNVSSQPSETPVTSSNTLVVKPQPPRNQGHWSAVSAIVGGTPFESSVTESITLAITGEQYEVHVGDKVDKGTCTTDVSQSPNRMTITGTDGPNAGKTFLAIFDLPSDDQMRVCYDLSGSAYPTAFDSTPENKLFLATYTRIK